jgi:hypothetical protein
MKLTLGDDAALTEETIIETLERVSGEIKREEVKKVEAAIEKQQSTQKALEVEEAKTDRLRERLYWKCDRTARVVVLTIMALILALLISGLLAGIGVRTSNRWGGWILAVGAGGTLLFSLANFIWGTTVKGLRDTTQAYVLRRLLLRESKATGLEIAASL